VETRSLMLRGLSECVIFKERGINSASEKGMMHREGLTLLVGEWVGKRVGG
jgi:hypothetical protein